MANVLDQLLPSMVEKMRKKKKKSGLEIYFPVSAYQHETSASAALAPTDSQHYWYSEIATYMQHNSTMLPWAAL